jgi:putative MATE family efflux protein
MRAPKAGSDPGLWSQVIKVSWPASTEYLITTSIAFADILLLARLGTEVLAGVGISLTVLRFFYEAFFAVAVATTTVVAQAFGAQNKDLARRGAAQSVLLAVCIGVVSGGIGIFVTGLAMTKMGAAGLVWEAGATYMRITLLASPLYAAALAGGGALRGVGDTRTPMLYAVFSSALKIVLSVGLIFGRLGLPALGVRGAAIATIFGYGLNAVLILAKLSSGFDGISLGMRAFLPDWGLLKRIAVLAWPVAAERMIMRMGFIFYMRVVSALGTVALAANQIALRLESLFLTVGFGFTIAATTLVGQAIGRRDIDGAVTRAWATVKLSVLTMGSMTVLLILIRHWAVAMFKPDPGVADLAIACIVIGAFELPAFGLLFTFAGTLRGAGDTLSPMAVALVGTFAFRLPLVYLLGVHFGLGLKGIWYGTLLDWIGRAILIYLIFRWGRWKRRRFVREEEARIPADDPGKGGLR